MKKQHWDSDDKFSHDDPRFDRIEKWDARVYTDMLCKTNDPFEILALLLSCRYLRCY